MEKEHLSELTNCDLRQILKEPPDDSSQEPHAELKIIKMRKACRQTAPTTTALRVGERGKGHGHETNGASSEAMS